MKNSRSYTVKIEGKKWQDAIEKALDEAVKKAKIDGFRKGHVPKDVFIKKYGKASVFMDAADLCLEDAYTEMQKANSDVEIIAQPDIKLNKIDEKELEIEFNLTLKPEVKLGKYTGLKVKKEKIEVKKEEIKETIDQMRSKYTEEVLKDGKVVNGDIAIINFEGFKDGIAFEGGKGENYSLTIGSGSFIPGFEEQLIGMKKDEEREIEVTFPEEYHSEDLKGQKAIFKVTINEIKELKIPELNEEFYEDLGMEGVNSKETLEEEVKKIIEARKDMDAENKYLDDLLEAAAKNVSVELPEVLIHEESHRMVHQYEDNLKMQGLTLEQFYQFTNSNEEKLMEQMKDEATKRVTYRLMLEEIAKEEKIEISDKQADEEATKLAEKYQTEKEEFLKMFGGIDMIKYDLKMRSAIEVLKK